MDPIRALAACGLRPRAGRLPRRQRRRFQRQPVRGRRARRSARAGRIVDADTYANADSNACTHPGGGRDEPPDRRPRRGHGGGRHRGRRWDDPFRDCKPDDPEPRAGRVHRHRRVGPHRPVGDGPDGRGADDPGHLRTDRDRHGQLRDTGRVRDRVAGDALGRPRPADIPGLAARRHDADLRRRAPGPHPRRAERRGARDVVPRHLGARGDAGRARHAVVRVPPAVRAERLGVRALQQPRRRRRRRAVHRFGGERERRQRAERRGDQDPASHVRQPQRRRRRIRPGRPALSLHRGRRWRRRPAAERAESEPIARRDAAARREPGFGACAGGPA